MYEFIKTPRGWRVFWGIDPLALQSAAQTEDEETNGTGHPAEEQIEMPSPRAGRSDNNRPAA